MAVLHSGAKLVWADVDPKNGNLSPDSIAEKITSRTKAIMVVHYAGIPAAIRRIRSVAQKRGIPVIEDAAHALGATYEGQNIGNHSEYTMFSFQAIKHMTTVDGGMLVCKNPEDLPSGRRVRWFGIDRAQPRIKVNVREVGYKYHMNDVTATIGLAQLEGIRPVLDRHIDNGRYYDRAFVGVPGVDLCQHDPDSTPAYWLYTILVDRRDDLMRKLTEAGVDCSLAHRRNDEHSVFASSRTSLPGLDRFFSRMLHIPCGWWVTDEQREYVVDRVRDGW